MRKHLSEPWFSLVCTGQKKFEGRLGSNEEFAGAPVGSLVTWFNNDLPFERTCVVKITRKDKYQSFLHMLEDKGVRHVLPTVPAARQGVAVYRRFFTESKERASGVLCLRMKVLRPE